MDTQTPAGPGAGAPGPQPGNGPGPSAGAPHPAPDGPQPTGAQGFWAGVRRTGLYRSEDRWIGGVAGGVAARLNVDPLLVRGVLAVTFLLGGLGLLLYGVAWALLPEQRDGRIHLEQLVAGAGDVALLGALGFVLVGLARGDSWWWFWDGTGWFSGLLWLAFVGGLVALVVLAVRRRGGPPRPGPWVAPGAPYGPQPYGPVHPTAPYGTPGAGPAAGPTTGATPGYAPGYATGTASAATSAGPYPATTQPTSPPAAPPWGGVPPHPAGPPAGWTPPPPPPPYGSPGPRRP
ncbi:PspC domain-containing protein, partial [Cellulomonas sp. 179-A 9B4 NHS]|uniref:PspC domain-containing protein n=1 Tax=Cellulomonas sp. 179-A 9B4 NHS TaxID=3142379 RepID=UPI00399FBF3E